VKIAKIYHSKIALSLDYYGYMVIPSEYWQGEYMSILASKKQWKHRFLNKEKLLFDES
jgi:hypothetical protein